MALDNDEAGRANELGAGLLYALTGDPAAVWTAIVEYLNDKAMPEEIFDNAKLERWSRARGYTLPE